MRPKFAAKIPVTFFIEIGAGGFQTQPSVCADRHPQETLCKRPPAYPTNIVYIHYVKLRDQKILHNSPGTGNSHTVCAEQNETMSTPRASHDANIQPGHPIDKACGFRTGTGLFSVLYPGFANNSRHGVSTFSRKLWNPSLHLQMAPPAIYLSAATADLRSYRARVERLFVEAGLQVFSLQEDPRQDWSTIRRSLREAFRQCGIFVNLVGFSHGAEPTKGPPGAPRRSVPEIAYHLALDLRIPVCSYLLLEKFPFDARPLEAADKQRLQLLHRSSLKEHIHLWQEIATPQDLEFSLQSLIEELEEQLEPPEDKVAAVRAYWWHAWLLRIPLLWVCAFACLHVWELSEKARRKPIQPESGSLLAGLSPEEMAAEREEEVVEALAIERQVRDVVHLSVQMGNLREEHDWLTRQELAIALVAKSHGKDFTAFQNELRAWARMKRETRDSSLHAALGLYLLGEHDLAAAESRRMAEASEKAVPRNSAMALSSWLLAGHCHLQRLKFPEALEAYRRAMAHTSQEVQPLLWSDIAIMEGLTLRKLGKWQEAEEVLQSAVTQKMRYLPPDSPAITEAMTSLAFLKLAAGEAGPAAELLKEALASRQRHYAQEDLTMARMLADLGEAQRINGQQQESEVSLCRSLEILEALEEKDGPEAARVLGMLGRLLADTGKGPQALLLCEKALALQEKHFDSNHPRVARELSTVALLSTSPEKRAKAEELQRRATAIMKGQFGARHAEAATAMNNLAGLCLRDGRTDEAEALFREALAVDEEVFGKDHPQLLRDIRNLAAHLRATNQQGEAIALYLRALGLSELLYGKKHEQTVRSLRNLSLLLMEARRPSEAEPFGRRMMETAVQVYGPDHLEVARCARDLAFCLGVSGQLREAAELYAQAQSIAEKALGADDISVFWDVKNRGTVLRDLGDKAAALEAFRRTYATARRIFGPAHPQTLAEMAGLGAMMRDTKNLADAEYLFRDLLAAREKTLGPHNATLARDLSDLAGVLYLRRQFFEAEPLYRRALGLLAASAEAGKTNPLLADARKNYESTLRRLELSDPEISDRMRKVENGDTVLELTSETAKAKDNTF